MARPVTLFTGQWADLPLETLARKASEFGYDGLELACWGDHFEVDKAVADSNYCREKRDLLDQYDLQCSRSAITWSGQAVCDKIDERHKAILPPHVWGDGDPDGVQRRAAEEMKNTARAAQKLGVGVVNGFTGSSIWHLFYAFPPVPGSMIDEGFKQFADRWNPILDVFGECGVKFALEVHPTEIAFDIYSAQRAMEAIGNREEFGFNFDPSHLLWQGSIRWSSFARSPIASITCTSRTRSTLERPHRHSGQPSQLRRSAPRLGLPLAGSRRRELRGDHPRAQRNRLQGPAVGRMGRLRHGPRTRREEACEFVKKLDFAPSNVAFDAAFEKK